MSDPAPPSPAAPDGPPAQVVDALGKACPLPVIWLAKAVAEVAVGEEVVVLADDPGAKVDIPVWCRMRRQELRGVAELAAWERPGEPTGGRQRPGYRFTIGKVI